MLLSKYQIRFVKKVVKKYEILLFLLYRLVWNPTRSAPYNKTDHEWNCEYFLYCSVIYFNFQFGGYGREKSRHIFVTNRIEK